MMIPTSSSRNTSLTGLPAGFTRPVLPVLLGPEVEALLGNQFHAWSDAFERGPIDLNSSPPITADDHALTAPEAEVTIAVLANDSDPDGDPLVIDGIAQPHHGLVFDNGDGTLTYRPDFDFQGQDRFRYWASDDNGNYTPATGHRDDQR